MLTAQIQLTMTPLPKPQRALQIASPHPSFWTFTRRSVWDDMHGHLWITLCCAWAAVGAAAAPSVLVPSCDASHRDGAAAAATLTRPPQHDVQRVRLVVLFWSTPCWSSESEHKPTSRRSTTETQPSLRFGMQQHCLDCYVTTSPGGPLTPWKYGDRLVQGCYFQMVPLV